MNEFIVNMGCLHLNHSLFGCILFAPLVEPSLVADTVVEPSLAVGPSLAVEPSSVVDTVVEPSLVADMVVGMVVAA